MYKKYRISGALWIIFVFLLIVVLTNLKLFQQSSFNDFIELLSIIALSVGTVWVVHALFIVHIGSKLSNNWRLFLSNLSAAVILTLALCLLFLYLPASPLVSDIPLDVSVINLALLLIKSFFISILAYLIFNSQHVSFVLQRTRLENEKLKHEHLLAQLIALQQQVNPHFLFNSLNTLRTIAQDKPTKDYITQLASVYRYLLNFNKNYLSIIREELDFVNSYLYILEQRFEDNLKVTITIDSQFMDYRIPPLTLQLLIENAVKHNTISHDRPLFINIYTDDNQTLVIENELSPKFSDNRESIGTGLANIRERYRLLLKKEIIIIKANNKFAVYLPMVKQ